MPSPPTMPSPPPPLPLLEAPRTIIATLHNGLVHLGFENAADLARTLSHGATDLATMLEDSFGELVGMDALQELQRRYSPNRPGPMQSVHPTPLRLRAAVDQYNWNCVATLHNGVVHIGRKVCTKIEDLLFMVQDSFADLFGMAAFRELQEEQAFMDRMYHDAKKYELLLRIEME